MYFEHFSLLFKQFLMYPFMAPTTMGMEGYFALVYKTARSKMRMRDTEGFCVPRKETVRAQQTTEKSHLKP